MKTELDVIRPYALGFAAGVGFFENDWEGPSGDKSLGELSLDFVRTQVAADRAWDHFRDENQRRRFVDGFISGFLEALRDL